MLISLLSLQALVIFVAAAGFELPTRSHRDFPERYIPSFPGGRENEPSADAYLHATDSRGSVQSTRVTGTLIR